jgi:hypothetical protein
VIPHARNVRRTEVVVDLHETIAYLGGEKARASLVLSRAVAINRASAD